MTDRDDEAFLDAARAVYGQYVRRFVEGLSMCPWAERSRLDGHTREIYLLGTELDTEAALAAIDALAVDPTVEVGLVVFPEATPTRADFERFVATLRERDVARCKPARPELALAAFHPDAEPNDTTAYRLVPFIRRSPDPVVQCVRVSVLDELRKGDRGSRFLDPSQTDLATMLAALKAQKAPLHERVAERNLETLRDYGLERARALLDALLDERDARYAPFGVPPRRR